MAFTPRAASPLPIAATIAIAAAITARVARPVQCALIPLICWWFIPVLWAVPVLLHIVVPLICWWFIPVLWAVPVLLHIVVSLMTSRNARVVKVGTTISWVGSKVGGRIGPRIGPHVGPRVEPHVKCGRSGMR